MFQPDTRELKAEIGNCLGGLREIRTLVPITSVSAKSLAVYSGICKIYLRLSFAAVSSTPRESVSRLSVICLHYPASSSAYFNKRNIATSWKQEQ